MLSAGYVCATSPLPCISQTSSLERQASLCESSVSKRFVASPPLDCLPEPNMDCECWSLSESSDPESVPVSSAVAVAEPEPKKLRRDGPSMQATMPDAGCLPEKYSSNTWVQRLTDILEHQGPHQDIGDPGCVADWMQRDKRCQHCSQGLRAECTEPLQSKPEQRYENEAKRAGALGREGQANVKKQKLETLPDHLESAQALCLEKGRGVQN